MDHVITKGFPAGVSIPYFFRQLIGKMRDYTLLIKLRLSLLVLSSALMGFWLAAGAGFDRNLFLWLTVGVFLIIAGANAANEILEREPDARMRRTAARPLPAGRMTVHEALWLSLGFTIGGFVILGFCVNGLTFFLGLLAYLLYVFAYTPLKKVSPLCVLIGAFPGAIPAMMGPTAVHSQLSPLAWILFGIVFLWQFPHFCAIAWVAKEDYLNAGFKVLAYPNDVRFTAYEILIFSCGLLGLAPFLTYLRAAGSCYLFGSISLTLLLIVYAVVFWLRPNQLFARRLMGMAMLYLPSLFLLMILDKVSIPW